MSEILPQEIIAEWSAVFSTKATPHEKSQNKILFKIWGKNGGTWFLNSQRLLDRELENSNIACIIEMSDGVLTAIYKGELNPQEAYLDHKISISGDEETALYFSSVIWR